MCRWRLGFHRRKVGIGLCIDLWTNDAGLCGDVIVLCHNLFRVALIGRSYGVAIELELLGVVGLFIGTSLRRCAGFVIHDEAGFVIDAEPEEINVTFYQHGFTSRVLRDMGEGDFAFCAVKPSPRLVCFVREIFCQKIHQELEFGGRVAGADAGHEADIGDFWGQPIFECLGLQAKEVHDPVEEVADHGGGGLGQGILPLAGNFDFADFAGQRLAREGGE